MRHYSIELSVFSFRLKRLESKSEKLQNLRLFFFENPTSPLPSPPPAMMYICIVRSCIANHNRVKIFLKVHNSVEVQWRSNGNDVH